MALTVTNVNSLSLLNILNRTNTAQSNTLQRLSTGMRINRGQDDPAGLLALKALEGELTSVNAALVSGQRTDAMLSVADKSLGEVATLLSEIQSLAAASSNKAGLTGSQLAANQAQIDNAISSIDRIIRTTEFNGQKLLDGSLAIDVSGGTNLNDIHVYSRDPNVGDDKTMNISVTTAATQASTGGGTALATNSADVATTISIKGAKGVQVIEIAAGENLSSVVSKINDITSMTGVVASQATAAGAIHLHSSDYGSDEFVTVTVLNGGTSGGSAVFNAVTAEGTDAAVTVNGSLAASQGRDVFYNHNGLSLTFKLDDTSNQAGQTSSFTIIGGGATFQLGTDATTRATLGIDGFYSGQLGTGAAGETLAALKSGGSYDLISDSAKAAEIAESALAQVATLQGRIGGFQKYQVQTSLSQMNAMKESLTAVKSIIGDVDYATETAELNRQNVLMQSAISLLGLANQQSGQVLSLLR